MDLVYAPAEMPRWDFMTDAEKEWAATTRFGGCCSGCGELLPMESDFAQHFIILEGYRNLGYCPVKGR